MVSAKILYNAIVQKPYTQLAVACSSELVATALLIVLYSLCLLLLRHLCRPTSSSTGNGPLWLQGTLILDPTIEYPLIFAFHPTVLSDSYRHQHPPFPSAVELLAQVAVFFAVELLLENCVLRFVQVSPLVAPNVGTKSKAVAGSVQQQGPTKSNFQDDDDLNNGLARRLVMDFVRPRGTLMLAVALLGTPSTALARWTGRLHPIAMVYWVALQQIVEF